MNFTNRSGRLAPLISGIGWALAILAVLTIVLSFLLWLTSLREASLTLTSYVIHAIAIAVGGFVSGRKGEAKGWYHGATLGVVYAVVILLVGFLALDARIGWQAIPYVLLAGLCGSLGGIIGVNTKK